MNAENQEKNENSSKLSNAADKNKKILEKVQKKAEILLKNESFSEQEGDQVVVVEKSEDIYFAFIKSNKRGSFGQAIISGKDFSYLTANSNANSDELVTMFKYGVRSNLLKSTHKRCNVLLPVIEQDEEILSFANKLTQTFMGLFDDREEKEYDFAIKNRWYKMIYCGIVLLLSPKQKYINLIHLTTIYNNPSLVKEFLRTVRNREVYEFWRLEVAAFMRREDAYMWVNEFNRRIASLIGEQEIQDLCRNYGKKEESRMTGELLNETFTKKYLDEIIDANQPHSLDEWQEAVKKLNEIMKNLKLDIRNFGINEIRENIKKDKMVILEAKRMNGCLGAVLNKSLQITSFAANHGGGDYDQISETIREAWWELISFFDYSPKLNLNIYSIAMFNNAIKAFETSINSLK